MATICANDSVCNTFDDGINGPGSGPLEYPVGTPGWWTSTPPPTHCDLQVDPDFTSTLTGTVYAQVREADSLSATTAIDTDDEWLVDIHITVSGDLIKLWCGYWCISICLEGMCAGDVYRFPQDITSPPGPCCLLCSIDQGTTDYDARICVPAGMVQVNECGAPYELTVIVTALSETLKPGYDPNDPNDQRNPNAHIPFGIATACELPLVTFYEGI